MKTASSLTLLAIGAILTFAVTAHPRFLNLQVTGVVLMAVGVAGFFMPRRGYGWLRRRMVVRRSSRRPLVSQVEETRYPPYIMLNPGASADDSLQPGIPVEQTVENIPTIPENNPRAERRAPADPSRAADSEVVDEYLEE